MNNLNRIDIKQNAKKQIENKILIILLLCVLISLTAPLALLGVPLNVGFFQILYDISLGNEIDYNKLKDGYNDLNFAFNFIILYILIGIYTFLWSLLFIIPGIVKFYSYSLAPYILIKNRNLTATEALNESKRLMNGKKADKFMFDLSFIGHFILVCLTLGLYLIYFIPYFFVANNTYYFRLVENEYA